MEGMKFVFFDAAGTLFHLAEPVGTVYARYAEPFGFQLDGHALDHAFRSIWGSMPSPWAGELRGPQVERDWWAELVRRVLATEYIEADDFDFPNYFNGVWEHYRSPDAWKLYEETVEVLEALKPRVGLGVISNFDSRLYDILKGLEIRHFFDVVTISAQAEAIKPDERIYQAALGAAGCQPEEAMHVGDDPEADWAGGEAAGMKTLELKRPVDSLRIVLDAI